MLTIREAMEAEYVDLAERIWGPGAPAVEVENKQGPRPQWHVILTEPQREATTATRLGAAGFRAYAPFFPKSIRQNYFKRREILSPIFPGYIFLAIDRSEEWFDEYFSAIKETRGVRDFMRFASGGFVRLRNLHIKRIRKTEWRLSLPPFKVGDKIEIEQGPWAGQLSTIERLDDRGRIGVLLSLFGRLTPVEVSVNQVRPL